MAISSTTARALLRRWLVLPAAVAGMVAALVSGAGPARAGSGCNLRYYYGYDGSPDWHSMLVSPYQSCSVPPAIVRYNGGTTIAAVSDLGSSFTTYVNPDGAPNWQKNDGWGATAPVGALAMTPYSGGTEFAVPIGNTLLYDWETGGLPMPGGRAELVASQGIALSAPAMTRTSGATEIAAAGSDNSLSLYWNTDGSPNWGSRQIAGPSLAFGAPAITATDYSTAIATIAPDASLWFYWAVNGSSTWYPEEVAGPGSAWGGLAMTDSAGATEITAPGPGGSLWFYWAVDGTSTWHAQEVAGSGSVQGSPAMVAAGNAMEIAATATDGSLWFYWAVNGSTSWHPAQVAGPGSTSASPAMVRSDGATEIAAEGQ